MKALLFYSTIAFFTTLLGSLLLLWREAWAKRHLWRLLSLGSGILLGVAFLHLYPESFLLAGKYASLTVVCIFGFLFAAESFTMVHACEGFLSPSEEKIVPYSALAALVLHAMVDGLAIGVGLRRDLLLGSVISVGVILHKFADGLTLTTLLRASAFSQKNSLMLAVFLALATPLGACLSYLGVQSISPITVGVLLAATAGSFIYIAAADLLPRIHQVHDRYCLLFFIIGLAAVGIFA